MNRSVSEAPSADLPTTRMPPRDAAVSTQRWTPTIRPRGDTSRGARAERAALVGSVAAFLAVASAAAMSTLDEVVRWPALFTFVVAIGLAIWARRVLGPAAPPRD
jgi:hypothetical protein